MSDDPSLNHSCMQALGAAILDSTDIGGATEGQLCRALTEFASFSNRLDEEIQSLTKEQLEKTLEIDGKFRLALDMKRKLVEERAIQHNEKSDNPFELTM
ncbi:hypothetical protein PMAYCL1PPCAC_13822, partial [Pristionchus mayeri]